MNKKGFTLIELLVVVAILGIIAAIGISSYNGYVAGTKQKSVENAMMQMSLGQTEYYSDNGSYYTKSCPASDSTSSAIEADLLGGTDSINDELGYNICIDQDGSSYKIIAKEVAKFNTLIADDVDITMTIPHENFHRDIGDFGGKNCYTDCSLFEGTEQDQKEYLLTVLPTTEDEEALVELMKLQWIEDKPLSAGQIASGIGATA